ncbi:MAG: glycosyltransferase [Candidatus Ancillula sp.]|nr:glycosyltransferase [Candidatus Ancillula sp.]
MSDLSISIIIPAYNEGETIIPCLQSCVDQELQAKEIIVVDNLSKDNTLKQVQAFKRGYEKKFPKRKGQISILKQDQVQGLIPTRNLGFASATGDILGRIDADAILSPGWTKAVATAFKDPKVMGATGPVTYYDMPLRRFSYKRDNAIRKFIQRRSNVVPMMFGTNMAIRQKAWASIGREFCLDKEDVLHEDIDISIHFAEHSYKVVYVQQMIAGMSARRIEDNFKDFKAYQQRMITTFEKHDMPATIGAKMSKVIFLVVWYPLHALRKPYMRRFERMKKQFISDLWSDGGSMSPFRQRAKLHLRKAFRKRRRLNKS